MKLVELRKLIARGEDSRLQFKADVHNVDALAAEMVAFSNSEGGQIVVGVGNDDGEIVGLSRSPVGRVNQMIGNAASQHVRSPISPLTENVVVGKGRVVIVVAIPKGIDKPYFDRGGVIWLNNAADKRRVNSKEESRRLFQMSGQFHADELPTKAGVDALDKLRFPMSPRGCCLIMGWAPVSNAHSMPGRGSISPTIAMDACSPPRFTESRSRSWCWTSVLRKRRGKS